MMKTCPAVAVIVPTYNHARFLRIAINSILRQTFTDWEAIIVNNYSADNTIEIVESYQDPRIRLINYDNAGVIAASRNHGASLTRAPFLAFLDSDDCWYPKKLELCIEKLAQEADLVCHAELWVGPGDRTRAVCYGPLARSNYRDLLLRGNCISTSSVVLRSELFATVGGFSTNPRFVTAEDYDLWLRLAQIGAKFDFIKTVLGEYHLHGYNNSKVPLRNMEAVMSVFQYHKNNLKLNMSDWRIKRREAVILYAGARDLQRTGLHGQAWFYLFQAILRYPWVPRFYAAIIQNVFALSAWRRDR